MIIYECVFFGIIGPISCMGDRDDITEIIMDYEEKKDYEGLTQWLVEQFIINFKDSDINYLQSRTIQHTICYYLNCMHIDKLIRTLDSDLIGFEDYNCFTNALKTIYDAISKEIGPVNVTCSNYILDDKSYVQDVFTNSKGLYKYMNT